MEAAAPGLGGRNLPERGSHRGFCKLRFGSCQQETIQLPCVPCVASPACGHGEVIQAGHGARDQEDFPPRVHGGGAHLAVWPW